MGNFYTSYTLRGPSQQDVANALTGRSAFVAPQQNGCVVVFDEQSDEQNQSIISELAAQLSDTFNCPVLAVLNHDDDIFWYQLFLSGTLADEYDSSPGYFDATAQLSLPIGGDAQKLCKAFGVSAVAEVETVLRKPTGADKGYLFAVERHSDLASLLKLPSYSAGYGFDYIDGGDGPDGFEEGDWIQLSPVD